MRRNPITAAHADGKTPLRRAGDLVFPAVLFPAAVLLAVVLLAAGCSSSGGTSSTAPPTNSSSPVTSSGAAPPASSTATSATAVSATTASSNLSGTWSGRYSGTYSGTFHLHWQQSTSKLSGSITLSAPATTLSLNGTVRGTAISFGTVGSAAITYSGAVSGDSMSGTYRVNGSRGGSWSATKSS